MKGRYLTGLAAVLLIAVVVQARCNYGARNRDPVAADYEVVTAAGVPVTVVVRARASDPDGDPLHVVAVTQGSRGTVTLNSDHTVTYAPDEGFDGQDRFTYTIDDDHGGRDTGSVTVTVLPEPGIVVAGHLYSVREFIPAGTVDAAAWGLNDPGEIAGSALFSDGRELPVFIDGDGRLTVIDVPTTLGRAFGINNQGLVTGFYLVEVEDDHVGDDHDHDHMLGGVSFVWDAGSANLVTVYEIPGALGTFGLKNNEANQIVGEVEMTDRTLGFLRQPDGTTSTFSVPGAFNTFGGGINNAGVIVGGFSVAPGETALHSAFILGVDGALTTFHVLDEAGNPLWTKADAINDAGEVVGHYIPEVDAHDHSHDHDHGSHAAGAMFPFLRLADGTVLRFNLPNATQARFSDINNLGVISGFTVRESGVLQALILTPIPAAADSFFADTPVDDHDHDHDHSY